MNCEVCGEPCKNGMCKACNFISNHPEVLQTEWDEYLFWRMIEAEAQLALENTYFRERAEIHKKNLHDIKKKLKKYRSK